MRLRVGVMAVSLAVFAVAPLHPRAAGQPYCPDPTHQNPAKAPANLKAAIATAFEIENAAVGDAAFVRCVGGKLMACYGGANLDCFKADKRRALHGATAWCRDNPGAKGIPMSATGHATIYPWSCKGRRAVPGKAVMTVDRQGYIAENWREIR